MELARLLYPIVCSRKSPGLEGVKLFLAQPLDEHLRETGERLVIADRFSAGIGQVVWWVGGREAALALPETFVPVDAATVAIADEVYARGVAANPHDALTEHGQHPGHGAPPTDAHVTLREKVPEKTR